MSGQRRRVPSDAPESLLRVGEAACVESLVRLVGGVHAGCKGGSSIYEVLERSSAAEVRTEDWTELG